MEDVDVVERAGAEIKEHALVGHGRGAEELGREVELWIIILAIQDHLPDGPVRAQARPGVLGMNSDIGNATGTKGATEFEEPGEFKLFDMGEDGEGRDGGEEVVGKWEMGIRRGLKAFEALGQMLVHPLDVSAVDIAAPGFKFGELCIKVADDASGSAANIQNAIAGSQWGCVLRDGLRDAQRIGKTREPVVKVAIAVVKFALGGGGNGACVALDVDIEGVRECEIGHFCVGGLTRQVLGGWQHFTGDGFAIRVERQEFKDIHGSSSRE